MKLRYSIISFLLVVSSLLWAAAPNGYYTSSTLDGKNTANLRSALQTIITNGHSVVSYTGLWTAYATTDINPSTNKIWDMYSNCSFTLSTNQCGTYSVECDCYNREHSTPQSWFGGSAPMYSDLFNVYPTDGKVNGMRSNYPYGEVGSASYTSQNGSLLGTSSFSGYSGTVFEPIDEYKGDFARTYFYMATRYAGLCESWTGEATVIYGSANLGLTTYGANLFLAWSRQDPVSAKEIARNDNVYGVQNNRNPFIDFPGLEEYIWGNKTSQTFYVSGAVTVTSPIITTPSSANIANTTATLGGNITSLGNGSITESGIYYSTTNGFADGAGTKVTGTATTTGAFTVAVSGLTSGTTYYYKAFATNSAGVGYTSQGSFTTTSVVVVAPTVTSANLITANTTSATVSANITSDGGSALTEKGFYWSTTNGFANGAGTKVTVSGASAGVYNATFSSLTPSTTYYFKAFATNSVGTSYTSQASFSTAAINGPVINAGTVVTSGATLSFGTVTGTTTKSLLIKTKDITGDLTVAVVGSGFTVSTTTISQTNAESGYPIMVTLTPVASGAYSGTLTISGGGLVSNYQVSLTGTK